MHDLEHAKAMLTAAQKDLRALTGMQDSDVFADEGFAVARGEPVSDKRYVEMLVNVLPDIRNDYAHGTPMLHNQSITSLQIAADFINQLFPHESV